MKTYLAQHCSARAKRSVAALAVTLTAGAGALAFLPASAHAAQAPAASPGYVFQTLNNQADPTFNQLLGINSSGVISGYFGSGTAGHPNKGYLLDPAYQQSNYVNENFPSSQQTQVTGLNNKGDTAGFWVNTAGTNRGFVEWNGSFTSFTNPLTPKKAGSVNQLLGINDKGIAVGFYNKFGAAHPYSLNQATGVFTALHVPGRSVLATGINNAGEIVGVSTTGIGVTSSWLLTGGHHLTSFQFPGGSDTQAFGINDNNQIVGSYLDGTGVQHGFLLTDPAGPVSHWTTIDDPNGVGSTLVNGINKAGDLVGFYTDSAGNTDGFLATPAVTVTKNLTLMPMPSGSATFGADGSGDLTVTPDVIGLTPGSAHTVQLVSNGSVLASFGPLTASGTGQTDATLDSSYTGSVPPGSVLVVLNGSPGGPVGNEPIAQSGSLSGGSGPVTLTAVEVTPAGKSYGTPAGTASITYNPGAQTLTVTVNASGLTPGKHAAHVHFGSCQSQGGVAYMLMDYTANSQGKVVNETRTLSSVTTPIPPSGWYLNLHQGNSNNILKNGAPTINFRPLLCANV
jgi:CHRD domain